MTVIEATRLGEAEVRPACLSISQLSRLRLLSVIRSSIVLFRIVLSYLIARAKKRKKSKKNPPKRTDQLGCSHTGR
jgi:hypothetical protein